MDINRTIVCGFLTKLATVLLSILNWGRVWREHGVATKPWNTYILVGEGSGWISPKKQAFHTVALFLINLKALISFQENVQFKNGAKSCIKKRLIFGKHKHRSTPSGEPWERDFLSVSRKQQRLLQVFPSPWHVTEFVCRKRLIEHRKRYVLTMLKSFLQICMSSQVVYNVYYASRACAETYALVKARFWHVLVTGILP